MEPTLIYLLKIYVNWNTEKWPHLGEQHGKPLLVRATSMENAFKKAEKQYRKMMEAGDVDSYGVTYIDNLLTGDILD